MTTETQAEPVEGLVVDEVIGLAVWCVSIADHHADILSARQVDRLYAASEALRLSAQQAEEVARLREALSDIVAEIQFPNALEAGFVHSGPTVRDMRRRVEAAQSIARAALAKIGGESNGR